MPFVTLLLPLLLFLAAIAASMFGQGGGVFYTPIQVWLGVGFHQAAATSLFLIMVLSFSATLSFRKAHEIDWAMVSALEVPTALGAFLGGRWSKEFSEETLSVLLATVLVVTAYFMIRSHEARAADTPPRQGPFIWRRRENHEVYSLNLLVALPIMSAIGLLTAMIGIGGGVLKVPVMTLLFRIPMKVAIGSSAVMVGITATGGFIGHASVGHWDWRTSLIAAGVVFIGAQIGSRLSVRLDQDRLKKVLGSLLLLAAVFVVIQAVSPG